MTHSAEFERFAACLRALKDRADLSYEALAQKTGTSRSSLHRYCSGSYVPQDYGSVHQFATACGASREELRHLHRLWALADARRTTFAGTGPEPMADPDPDSNPDPQPTRDPASAPDAAPAPAPASAPTPVAAAPARGGVRHRRRRMVLGASALVLATGVSVAVSETAPRANSLTKSDSRLLFSDACAETVSMGQQDACVREVQRLLARAGADIDVDSSFGPQTLRRVTAFQVLSGLTVNGVVGERTKKALYAQKTRMDTWSPEKVRQRIREVFLEKADRAVAIADCQSFLDPLHVLPNTNGTRNWGVFQISDARLRELGGTPRTALEPEWNIQAAYRLYQRAKDFSDWSHCDRAYLGSPSPSPSGSAWRRHRQGGSRRRRARLPDTKGCRMCSRFVTL
ncbi:helix-turn-helix domain-containing protein [Streptomyces sp. NBC_00075]|uniref:Helix-turn-helix domain-containing protein n=1 Tax=Streptomyces sp. NBC_00093 TaxID=2975649 RepID=A0AAU2A6R8_9ACTN